MFYHKGFKKKCGNTFITEACLQSRGEEEEGEEKDNDIEVN